MADKLMYIFNDNTQNYPFCRLQLLVKRLDTQLNEPTNQNSTDVRKRYYITLETSIINSLMSAPSLQIYSYFGEEKGLFYFYS